MLESFDQLNKFLPTSERLNVFGLIRKTFVNGFLRRHQMYSQAHKRALPEYKGPLGGSRCHPCTGCYTRLYEVLTESVSLLIENYIQAPPNGPTYSGIGKFLEPLSLPIQLTNQGITVH